MVVKPAFSGRLAHSFGERSIKTACGLPKVTTGTASAPFPQSRSAQGQELVGHLAGRRSAAEDHEVLVRGRHRSPPARAGVKSTVSSGSSSVCAMAFARVVTTLRVASGSAEIDGVNGFDLHDASFSSFLYNSQRENPPGERAGGGRVKGVVVWSRSFLCALGSRRSRHSAAQCPCGTDFSCPLPFFFLFLL